MPAHGVDLRLYPEEGVSAKDTDRPKLQELLILVRAGRVRTVVVTKLDRISRSLADLLDLMWLFEEHGCHVHFAATTSTRPVPLALYAPHNRCHRRARAWHHS
jgi:DNA invertase Pin-like site-specific DNA recombinase